MPHVHATPQEEAPPGPPPGYRVHKFGGSSLADATRIGGLRALLAEEPGPRLVVASAMQGTTDALVELGRLARQRRDWRGSWQALRDRHLQAARELA